MITHRTHALAAVLLLLVGVGGCGDRKPKPPELAEVFPNLPLPPHARFVSQAGGEDALKLTFRSNADQEAVEAYYKGVFTGAGWRLVSRTKTGDGSVVLLGEQQGPPLWVRIGPTSSSGTTVVELSGARTSGTKPATPGATDSAPARPAPRS
jgi:hypothetical protein